MKWFLLGATGFVGSYLLKEILSDEKNYVYLVSRKKDFLKNELRLSEVDFYVEEEWLRALEDSDVIINLAGAPIAEQRWTQSRKKVLYESRIEPIRKLKRILQKAKKKPKFYINSSALGYYGNLAIGADEESQPGDDFLARLCIDWEKEALSLSLDCQIPLALVRFAVALGRGGGYLKTVSKPFYFCLGGHFSSGLNHFSWIHAVDLSGILIRLAEESMSGVYNGVSPNSVLAKDFSKALGRVLGRPSWFHAPYAALRIVFGKETADFLTADQKIVSKNLSSLHYDWKYELLEDALRESLQ